MITDLPRRSATIIVALVVALGAAFGAPPAANASPPTPAAWVGSPLQATWPNEDGCANATYPSADCSLPSVHHITYLSANGEVGDWATDLQNVPAGSPVNLYVAPQDPGTPISARVERVGPACGSGDLSDGGYVVVVGIYAGDTKIGAVAFAHVDPSVSQGQDVGRWGTKLGAVGSYRPNSCWGGVHLHTEMISQRNYACYNKGWRPGQQMYATNFIGFVGGSYANGPRKACP